MDVLDFDFYERLKKDYQQHKSIFVAYDYDNTVFDYHNQGISYIKIIYLHVIKIGHRFINIQIIIPLLGHHGNIRESTSQSMEHYSKKIKNFKNSSADGKNKNLGVGNYHFIPLLDVPVVVTS